MIGGGSKKILEYAGREADIISLNFNNRAGMLGPDGMNSGLAAATARKVDWVRAGAGDRFADIELEIGAYNTIITDQQEATAAAIGDALGMSGDDILQHPHCLIGSLDFICEELQRRREVYGISYICVLDDGTNNMGRDVCAGRGTPGGQVTLRRQGARVIRCSAAGDNPHRQTAWKAIAGVSANGPTMSSSDMPMPPCNCTASWETKRPV